MAAESGPVIIKPIEWQITGKVTSANGDALPGVTVLLKGTTTGATTTADGTYSISVPEAAGTLIFSFIGFSSQEKTFSGPGTINITLSDDAKSLEEVVVIGYGTQKKAEITNAVATMSAEKLTERPIARVDQALVGQMSGVRVRQTSGVPGRGFSIQVRGTGSIGANNEPLYVIDGFPLEVSAQNAGGGFTTGNPLDNINPNDIESIQVLKDASAGAIYGSRASNGVVIITTKRGKTGKPKINFNTYAGVNQTAKKLDMLSPEEWVDRAVEMINAAWVASGPNRSATQTTEQRRQILVQRGDLPPGGVNPNWMIDDRWLQPGHPGLAYIDWQDEMFRRGYVQSYQLTANGGTENVNYYVSGDYLDQEGIAIGVGYRRYTGRANVEVKANDKLKFGLNIAPSFSVAKDPGVEGKDQQMHIAVSLTPVSEENVDLDVNVGPNTSYRWGGTRNSPIRVVENSIGNTEIFRTLGTLFAEYTVLEGLAVRTSLNLDNIDTNIKTYTPAFVSGTTPTNRQAAGGYNGYRKQTFVNENTLNYNRTLADAHNFSVLAGFSYNFSRFNNVQLRSAGGFQNDIVTTLNAAANISGTGNNFTRETQSILLSYFGRVQYNFRDRYLASASIRRDGSSRFGNETKWGVFPSASVGWRVSQEGFMQGVAPINDLKLRASWGIAGNNGLGSDYGHIPRLAFANYTFGNNLATGQVPANSAYPFLSWEESETVDLGFDLGLWENRIFTSFDYYVKTNRSLLINVAVPTASGFATALTNIGKVQNKGWELELSTRNLTGDFSWDTNINLTHNVNEIKQLGPNNAPMPVPSEFDIPNSILQVGQPLYSIWVVRQIGILTQADIDQKVPLYGTQTVGDPKYLDNNGDGRITADDRVIVGHPNPDYIWGITNNFRYKGFDLNVLVQGQWGGHIYSLFGRAVDRTGQGFVDNALGFYRDRWRSPEDPGEGKRGKAYSTFGRIKNTDWLYRSDYIRVRNITLGYNLGDLLKGSFVQGARVYATAENFFGKDWYLGGFNPEALNTNGEDYGAFPLAKSLVLGLNFTF
ncbi:SusC/RagA family TonB-linked outer membrane protein [Adhaeribacter aerolatus]|uniref:SusC/RagA family TonB-linked outer membrane protein n=1 Tax=Adhaeribacter aerolatus TaxID=670289 RepID=A0A512B2A6_9BACT|nr:SusC/RagA family TonB-linked outer membrane protein [Adhaeribacter aerolatus]